MDGISDQLLARWYAQPGGGALPLAGVAPELIHPLSGAGAGSSPIRYARFVVPWDVMSEPGGEALHFELFRGWLEDVAALGLTPDVAIEQAETTVVSGGAVLARVPSTQAQYERYVGALLDFAAAAGEPIAYLEAWNEPNATGRGPAGEGHPSALAAAAFTNAASSLCAQRSCQAIAGDFLDGQYAFRGHAEASEGSTGLGVGYEREYAAHLRAPAPAIWAVHPYAAVKYETPAPIAAFLGAIPDRGAAVWFTEAGVYDCQGGRPTGTGSGVGEQLAGARYLNLLAGAIFDVAHVFYYEPKAPSRVQETACPDGEDTSLYNYANEPRPTARLVFGSALAMPLAPVPFA